MTNLLERPIRRCRPSEDIVPFSECRNKLSAMIERTRKTHRPILITQNGRAASYLVDAEKFDSITDKIDLYEDVMISRQQIADGKGIPGEVVFKEMHEMIDRLAAKGN